ncbi:MAG: M48 family metallopeptidase [Actinobacteria bacterium]|nr:M48 family metallopeptidase [Actinomycetota bacterium]
MAAPARTVERRPAGDGRPPVEVVRSTRRRRSASAYARDGVVVVQLPAHLPRHEQERLIGELVDKVTGQAQIAAAGGDAALAARARRLADAYVDAVRPTSVRWSGRMRRRFGSATPADGSIRISRELAAFPDYVLDYVIVHELAHLVHADHSTAFETLVARYPDTVRARAFLDGFTAGSARGAIAPMDHDIVEPEEQADA